MRIESRRSIHMLALVALSLCLPLFAQGQETAVGITNSPAADLSRRLVAPNFDAVGGQTQAEAVVLPPSVPDPIEPLNRVMWGFNKALMTDVIKPTSKVYRLVVVKPVRTGNWKFRPEPHLPGTTDQQSAAGKVERRTR